MSHTWPGNVRELRHAVERAVILGAGPMLEAEDFSLSDRPSPRSPGGSERDGGRGLTPSRPAIEGVFSEADRLDDIEKNAIARVLQANKGNVSRAAEALGLTRGSLYRRM